MQSLMYFNLRNTVPKLLAHSITILVAVFKRIPLRTICNNYIIEHNFWWDAEELWGFNASAEWKSLKNANLCY